MQRSSIASIFGICAATSAAALTPLRSPEQLARDEALFARASRGIEARARTCFAPPRRADRTPVTIRFFLGNAGTEVSQLQVLRGPEPSAAMTRAAFRAVTSCAPYGLSPELRDRGGFWVTARFR
jgi:hypothetical protein